MSYAERTMSRIHAAVRVHGLHKVAAGVFAREGVAPTEWTDAGVGRALGEKVARDLIARREIAAGLVALARVAR